MTKIRYSVLENPDAIRNFINLPGMKIIQNLTRYDLNNKAYGFRKNPVR